MRSFVCFVVFFLAIGLTRGDAQQSPYVGHYQFYAVTTIGYPKGNPSLIGHFYINTAGEISGRAMSNVAFRKYRVGGVISRDGIAEAYLERTSVFQLPETMVSSLDFAIRDGVISGACGLGEGTLFGSMIYSNRHVPYFGRYTMKEATKARNGLTTYIGYPVSIALMIVEHRVIGFAANGSVVNDGLASPFGGRTVYLARSRQKGETVRFSLREPDAEVKKSPSGDFVGTLRGNNFSLLRMPKDGTEQIPVRLRPLLLQD